MNRPRAQFFAQCSTRVMFAPPCFDASATSQQSAVDAARFACDAANTIGDGSATIGIPRANATVCANEIETRSPVKPPGPVATAIAVSCAAVTPASACNARNSSQNRSRGSAEFASNRRSCTTPSTDKANSDMRCEQSTASTILLTRDARCWRQDRSKTESRWRDRPAIAQSARRRQDRSPPRALARDQN